MEYGTRSRPSGPAFHDMVTFEALIGGSDDLRELRLRLKRSFVDDPQNGAFALDITKSFLHDALGAQRIVSDLARRLAQRVDIRRADVTLPDPMVLSSDDDAVLQTYAGEKAQCKLRVNEFTLRLENQSGDETLVISLT